MNKYARPLSPFWIYRWRQTFFNLSIIHRATGIVLVVGLLGIVYVLTSIALGRHGYAIARSVLTYPVTRVLLIGLSWSVFYHLLCGLRHLAFDVGYGFEKATARLTGWVVVVGATALTVIYCVLFEFRHRV
jgi:succinate dehydrogenase / fumarate reductase cytochrome b subunit